MRQSGVLLPIFSLPGRYGIGNLGREAFRFVDFLAETGQNCWQVLPLNPTSFGDSPYQSLSAFAGNPYFIDPEQLKEEGLLTPEECREAELGAGSIDYCKLFHTRFSLLRKAFSRFEEDASFLMFIKENEGWLAPYVRFMERKDREDGRPWTAWSERTYRDSETAGGLWAFVQYCFFRQWRSLKTYANGKGIRIIGDMPIYVSFDSADVWAEPGLFQLTADLLPERVAGVPPDAFSEDGQLWGNPLYDWEGMERDGFSWWIRRFRHAFSMYDGVRIDHFRGFAAYYSIPYGEETARRGKWVDAPGEKLFEVVNRVFPDKTIIAEDLGVLDDRVRALLQKTGYPGIKVAQFGFDEENSEYLPSRYPAHCVAYSGTHDNMTTKQWIGTLTAEQKQRFDREIRRLPRETPTHALVRAVLESRAELAVIPIQDYLELGGEARINSPSTMGGNWIWRLPGSYRRCGEKMSCLRRSREK